MLQDRFRKKTKAPSGNGSSLETTDITDQVPEVDDVLAQIDKALNTAQELEKQVRPQDTCKC